MEEDKLLMLGIVPRLSRHVHVQAQDIIAMSSHITLSKDLPCVLILAAGRGERFLASGGSTHKLAAALGNSTVLEATLAAVQASGLPWHLERGPHPGMGDSIAAGVAACPDVDGWLIVLGDMPFILPSSIERVTAAMVDDAVSVPVQDGEFGHPVGFGRSFGSGLLALSGDRGARPLFKQGRVVEVLVDDPGVLWDIDVPEALVFK
ncbi:MAG: nucleotidyltransferase family protein [Comamonas sp.]